MVNYSKQYSDNDFVNDWDQSKKSLELKVKEALNLYYNYEDHSYSFLDGRLLDAQKFPQNLIFKISKEEKEIIRKVLKEHSSRRPFEVLEFAARLNLVLS